MRIEDLLRRNARRTPDATAIVCEHEVLTWAELESRANRLAHALRARGFREHERIAVVLPNCHHIPIAYFAIWKCNMVNVAINPRLTTSEMQRILQHCGAAAVVCDSDAAVAAASATSSVRGIFTTGEVLEGAATVASLVEDADDAPLPPTGAGSDLRSIRYTSGTTGDPKGCMATHEQQLASVSNFLIEVEVPRSAPTYLSVPMTLGVGAFYLTASAYLGVPLFIRRRFDPRQFLIDVEEHRIAHAFLVPTMLVDLVAELATRATPVSTPLTMIGYGGSQISWDVIRTLGAGLGCEFYQGLGATEAGGYATLLTPRDHAELLADDPSGSTPIGRAAAYARTRIVDPEGRDVTSGDTGELLINSASNFSGYWAQPEETRSVLDAGWLALGDMVWEDGRGFLHMVDRKQGVIRSGSQNVYAGEVESVLMSCPGVIRAAAIGVEDERFGESVRALVVRSEDSGLTEQAIIDHCSTLLSGYKRPRSVIFVPEIPVDDGGKIQRAELSRLGAIDDPGVPPTANDQRSLSS